MPNICNGQMRLKGKIKDIESFLKHCMNEKKPTFRRTTFHIDNKKDIVLSKSLNDLEDDREYYTTSIIFFDCAWSVSGCMLNRGIELTEEYNDEFTSLENLCKKYRIDCEIISTEPGMAFSEHIFVDWKGRLVESSIGYYYENWFDDNGNELDKPIISCELPLDSWCF